MELSSVVPWGRSLSEYIEMFSLSDDDLQSNLLGCGDGPASFNAELTQKGGKVVSVDPIYQFNAAQIKSRIDEAYSQVIEQVSKHKDDFVWRKIPDIECLGKTRMDAMRIFLADYEKAKDGDGDRYLQASLPSLPFDNERFDLALCSHYLFLYSDRVNQDRHILSMRELCRVAKEVRVYPLLSISDNQKSRHLDPAIGDLRADGLDVSLVEVGYEFQKGATKMLVAKRV